MRSNAKSVEPKLRVWKQRGSHSVDPRQIVFKDLDFSFHVDSLMMVCQWWSTWRTQAGFANFVGLRDFYAFIKLLDRSLLSANGATSLPPELLALAVQRSFSGIPNKLLEKVILEPFFRHCHTSLDAISQMRLEVPELLHSNLADLANPELEQVGARHLMVFGPSASMVARLLEEELGTKQPVTVIVGSSFPGDRSMGAIYQGIARIKHAMEMGGCVLLVHCEDIYESLYDMLNQLFGSEKHEMTDRDKWNAGDSTA